MARRDQYIVSKTDFVLRDRHALTSKGIIYENDHMTIVPNDGLFDEGRAVFSDSNFKFRIRTDTNEKRKHFAGNWIKADDGGEYWSEEDCSGETTTKEYKIVLNPDYSRMTDFAYYGSAQELVKASIRDVLMKYPGGLYYLGDENRTVVVDGVRYYVVSNEFGIDIWTPGVTAESVENPLKYLSASYDKYLAGASNFHLSGVTIQQTTGSCLNGIIAETTIEGRKFYTYLSDDYDHVILSKKKGTRGMPIIRLPEEDFIAAYDKLDDFSKVLLNLDSKPIFKASLESPYFDGQGYYMSKRNYVWPSVHTDNMEFFTPDMTSNAFNGYVARLMELATFHDEFDSNNMWRMLTHDSIKNLDWTFKKTGDDENTFDTEDFDSSRMKAAIELFGRQFDDLKRYADNIKYTNTITYDEKNNVPDYFLTDTIDNDGWEAHYVGPSTDNLLRSEVLYNGSYSGKTSSDANISFMRRLAINSDYIQSMKGTARGLEVILGLFGLEKGEDYVIKEYAAIADKFPSEADVLEALPYYDHYYYGDDIFGDWPIIKVDLGGEGNYVIPWYDKKRDYMTDIKFQQFGGWENTYRRKINLPITTLTEIWSNGDVDIYGETLQYLKYAADIYELTALTTNIKYENTVCYVEDISGLSDGYNADPTDQEKIDNGSIFSHYFILKNFYLSTSVGFVDNEYFSCYGWRNIFEDEFDGSRDVTCDGNRVLYLESIKTIEEGNNPHVGYGLYDMGEAYLDKFRHIFKDEINNGHFSTLSESNDTDTLQRIMSVGFGQCYPIEAPKKTMTFMPETLTPYGALENGHVVEEYDNADWESGLYSDVVNPEGSGNRDEAASFSVINVKKIKIVFSPRNEYHRDYIENVVLKYVEQMMPSTAIFSYNFINERFTATPVSAANGYGEGEFTNLTIDGVIADSNNGYMVEHPLPQTI